MKVLVVNTVPFDKNGITSVILNYYKKMTKDIEQIDFIAINDLASEYTDLFKQNGSQYFVIRNRKRNPLNYMIQLAKILKKNKYDIIHIHGNSTLICIELIVAYALGVNVRIAHSHNTTCDHLKLHQILRPLFNFLYTHGLACGEDAGKWMFEDKPFTILNNGIDLEMFKFNESERKKIRNELNIDDSTLVIGHVGGFVYQKNHEFLIKLTNNLSSRFQNFKIISIGDGPLRQEIENLAISCKVDQYIDFLGNISNVYRYYSVFDLFVLPSHFEGLPVVLIEAQTNGLMCIVSSAVTDEAKFSDYVFSLELNDISKWVDTIEQLHCCSGVIRYDDGIKRLIEKGFDISRNAEILTKYYKTLCSQKIN